MKHEIYEQYNFTIVSRAISFIPVKLVDRCSGGFSKPLARYYLPKSPPPATGTTAQGIGGALCNNPTF
jgi:hypothetical protein